MPSSADSDIATRSALLPKTLKKMAVFRHGQGDGVDRGDELNPTPGAR